MALLDIESGSVATAIAKVNHCGDDCEIIYAKRYPINHAAAAVGQASALRAVGETLLRAGRDLADGGVRTLNQIGQPAMVADFQVSVSAPLSQVVVKNVRYQTKKPFRLNNNLLHSLRDSIADRVWRELKTDGLAGNPDLVMLDSSVISVSADGYTIDSQAPDQEVVAMELVHLSSLIGNDLMTLIEEVKERVFPASRLSVHSFMFMYYNLMSLNIPSATNACLLDVTAEATEIGVIESGVLRYVGRVPYGVHTASRSLQRQAGMPFAESLTLVRHGDDGRLNPSGAEILVREEYRAALERELKYAGDTVTIPPVLFMHTTWPERSLLDKSALSALKSAGSRPGQGYVVTEDILGDSLKIGGAKVDTALQTAVGFFHKTRQRHLGRL